MAINLTKIVQVAPPFILGTSGVLVVGPFQVDESAIYVSGAAASEAYLAGSVKGETYAAGASAAEVTIS